MTLALIDIQSGNLGSVANALRAAGCDDLIVTADPDQVSAAERVVLPGVGAFGACAANLRAVPGLLEAIETTTFRRGRPFLGICVGMQLMAEYGSEHGRHDGMGWIAGTVAPLPVARDTRIPHMGWNEVVPTRANSLVVRGEAYFLHSYAYRNGQIPDPTIAETTHGDLIVAAVQEGTAVGVQFHPEKSQRYGIALLERFLTWRP